MITINLKPDLAEQITYLAEKSQTSKEIGDEQFACRI